MSTIISAGILLKSRQSLYLIAKPWGKSGTTGGWGIPKGKRDDNEYIIDAAKREFYEESDFNFNDREMVAKYECHMEFEPFFNYSVNAKDKRNEKEYRKQVYVFRAYSENMNILKFPFKCTSLLDSGNPEIEAYAWVTAEEAFEKVVKSQKGIFEFITNYNHRNGEAFISK